MTKSIPIYFALVGVNLVYACTSIFTKMASRQEMLSWPYLLWMAGAVGVMGVYAILWQQVLKRVELSTAYMFKGTGAVFGLLIVWLVLNEPVTMNNIIGTIIIITGVTMISRMEG